MSRHKSPEEYTFGWNYHKISIRYMKFSICGCEVFYHARNEFYLRWFIRIIFIKLHDKFERSIFKWCISRTNNNSIPKSPKSISLSDPIGNHRQKKQNFVPL